MQTITLKAAECLSIQPLTKRQYKDQVMKDGKLVDSQMKGKFYWICSSPKGRFVVEDGNPFLDAIKDGNVFTVDLQESASGWSFVGYSTTTANINMARAVGMIEQYQKGVFDFTNVKPEDIIA
jgi:hypothetical protein